MDGRKGQKQRSKKLYPRLTVGAPMREIGSFSSQTSEEPEFSGPGDEELTWQQNPVWLERK